MAAGGRVCGEGVTGARVSGAGVTGASVASVGVMGFGVGSAGAAPGACAEAWPTSNKRRQKRSLLGGRYLPPVPIARLISCHLDAQILCHNDSKLPPPQL